MEVILKYRFIIAGLFAIATAPESHAQQTPEGCIAVDPPRKISGMCNFERGVPMYSTRIRTVPIMGCPAKINVQYVDPESGQLAWQVATRGGAEVQTCKAGVTAVRVKPTVVQPDHRTTRPAAPQPAIAPPKTSQATPAPRTIAFPELHAWNSVAAGSWNDSNGNAHVSVGYARSIQRDRAVRNALDQCRSGGGQGCVTVGAFDFGCYYVTTGKNERSVAWGTGATAQAALNQCSKNGRFRCSTPIGGCVDR